MSTEVKCKVQFEWDDEASVWIATSKDVEGLVLESPSYDELLHKVRHAVPDLLKLNNQSTAVTI